MISSQKGEVFEGEDFAKIRKVYSIWICPNPSKERRNTITRYRMIEECLLGKGRDKEKSYDLITLFMVCLGEPDKDSFNTPGKVMLEMLNVLFSTIYNSEEKQTILRENFGIELDDALREEMNNMCNYSEGILQKGRAEGRIEGRAEGESRMVRLMQLLLGEQKQDDINRALTDDKYRQSLFAAYGL